MADKHIQTLLKQLDNEPTKYANNVAHLRASLASCKNEVVKKSIIHGLKMFFLHVSAQGDLKSSKRPKVDAVPADEAGADPQELFKAWLQRQLDAYLTALLALLSEDCSASLQVTAFSAVMEAVRTTQLGCFNNLLFSRLVTTLLTCPAVKSEVFTLLFTTYLSLADVAYYTCTSVAQVASQLCHAPGAPEEQPSSRASPQDVARNCCDVLMHMPELPEGEAVTSWCGSAEVGAVRAGGDKAESSRARRKRKAAEAEAGGGEGSAPAARSTAVWANTKNQRRVFGEAWLAFLRLPVPEDLYRKVLVHLPASVIPRMPSPLMLCDFLSHALDSGGLVGILALHGLFVLVTKHGLEYPAFFMRLYNLLTPEVFVAKYRPQFFKLVDVFLSSGLVPAYTVAAFVKRFGRLALTAPPGGAMLALAFIHNLIRRHPATFVLLHNPNGVGAEAAGQDVYDETAVDPVSSKAVESSLWELNALRAHYCPQVAAFTTILDKKLTDRSKTAEVDIQPLLTASYASLFNQEVGRKLRTVPLAFYSHPPTQLFDNTFPGWGLAASS